MKNQRVDVHSPSSVPQDDSRSGVSRHVHYSVEAMNDDGDWETPCAPHMTLADARSDALNIAPDYPRGVRIHVVRVESEVVWTNQS